MSPGQSDSQLRCTQCGRISRTNFAHSLRHGWEMCCGYTMTLERTEADMDAAVGSAFGEGLRAARALAAGGFQNVNPPRTGSADAS